MPYSKTLRTIALLLIAALAISGTVDRTSEDYARQGLNRALATFAVARALNGVISVAKGTEVAVEPGGVGVILAPGEVLDPIHDLIERFSGVMLIAASSLGLQMIVLSITSWWGLTALLLGALFIWLALIWSPRLIENTLFRVGSRIALMLIFVRFAVPLVIICTNFIFGAFLQTEQDSLTKDLTATSLAIDAINTQLEEATDPIDEPPASTPETPSAESDRSGVVNFWEGLANVGSQIRQSAQDFSTAVADWYNSINLANKITEIQDRAAASIENIVRLIAIFVLQTVIFPVGFLWLFVELLKSATRQSISLFETRSTNLEK
ncbi:MAG: hypothetical protein HKN35_16045 [Woeseia sp.]|nr:hypothetical protein [Woeseia sp.]NNE62405.1 hypothetical protein [Woeseia sp.]